MPIGGRIGLPLEVEEDVHWRYERTSIGGRGRGWGRGFWEVGESVK